MFGDFIIRCAPWELEFTSVLANFLSTWAPDYDCLITEADMLFMIIEPKESDADSANEVLPLCDITKKKWMERSYQEQEVLKIAQIRK